MPLAFIITRRNKALNLKENTQKKEKKKGLIDFKLIKC